MSPSLKRVLKSISDSRAENQLLSPAETITALKEMSKICEDELVLNKIILFIYHTDCVENNLKALSNREQQVFNLLGLSLTSKEIAHFLKITEGTVSTHRKHIAKKLNIKGSGQLRKQAYDYLNNNFKKTD